MITTLRIHPHRSTHSFMDNISISLFKKNLDEIGFLRKILFSKGIRDLFNFFYTKLPVQVYKGELNLDDGENFHDRPPLEIVIRKFRTAKMTAYAAAVAFTLLFVCIWPGSMLR